MPSSFLVLKAVVAWKVASFGFGHPASLHTTPACGPNCTSRPQVAWNATPVPYGTLLQMLQDGRIATLLGTRRLIHFANHKVPLQIQPASYPKSAAATLRNSGGWWTALNTSRSSTCNCGKPSRCELLVAIAMSQTQLPALEVHSTEKPTRWCVLAAGVSTVKGTLPAVLQYCCS